MNRVLTYEIPDEIYAALEQMGARSGRTAEACVLEYLARHASAPRRKMTEEESRAAQERFEQCIGSVSLGHPTGADNESIDADLAGVYGAAPQDEA